MYVSSTATIAYNGLSGDFGAGYTTGMGVGYSSSVAKGINMGWNTTYDMGFIGTVHNGTAWKSLILCPIGGAVYIGATGNNSLYAGAATFSSLAGTGSRAVLADASGNLSAASYQGAITLTTTGTSGVATFDGTTLNVPNYGSALSGYVPYTGATADVDLGTHSLTLSDVLYTNSYINTNGTGQGSTQIFLPRGTGDIYGTIQTENINNGVFSLGTTSIIGGFGTPVITWNYSGQVGINKNNPTVALDVNGAAKFSSTVTATQFIGSSTSNINVNGNAILLTSLDANGQYITFNTSVGNTGYIGNAYQIINSPNNVNTDFAIRANANLLFSSGNGPERMRIFSNGNVGINTGNSDNTYKLQVSGDIWTNTNLRLENGSAIFWNATNLTGIYGYSSGSIQFYANGGLRGAFTTTGGFNVTNLNTGTVYSNGGTLTNTNPSDSSLKNTIQPLSYGLAEIMQLEPKTFYYNSDSTKSSLKYGFIAQDVEKIMPDMVRKISDDSDKLGLESDGIYVTLINAIKELKAEMEQLKTQKQ